MSPCKKCFQQMVVNFCLNTWHRNVEIVTFLKWCLSVFTNNTCVLLGGLKEIFWGKTLLSHCWPIHCWLWRAFLQREFSWHQVQIRFSWSHPCLPWAGPLVSLTGAAPSDHTFYSPLCSEYCPLKSVNTIYIIFQHDSFFPQYFQKNLAAFSYQYLFLLVKVFFCMHYAILFTRSTPKNMAVT